MGSVADLPDWRIISIHSSDLADAVQYNPRLRLFICLSPGHNCSILGLVSISLQTYIECPSRRNFGDLFKATGPKEGNGTCGEKRNPMLPLGRRSRSNLDQT